MKDFKFLGLMVVIVSILMAAGCTISYTTIMTPNASGMLVTSGDLPGKEYTNLGFVESTSISLGFGIPTEAKISEMKSSSINDGLVEKAKTLGADAIINVLYSTAQSTRYLVLNQTIIVIKGTAIKFK